MVSSDGFNLGKLMVEWAIEVWRKWFPEPSVELKALRARNRALVAENRRLTIASEEATGEAQRQEAQAEMVARQLESAAREIREYETRVTLLETEVEGLALIVKRQQANEEHAAAIKMIDLEHAKTNVLQRKAELGGERL